ncbi:hypothetical protein AGMMS50218_02830 [Actinomycetota bacterium]|nr:hypothetical protein AGMMS50218_02830 [Actinomycetota bacterium]
MDSHIEGTARTPQRTKPSAGLLTSGLVALAIGLVLFQAGLEGYLGRWRTGWLDRLGESPVPQVALAVGALAALAGFAALVVGVHRLASALDARALAGRRS